MANGHNTSPVGKPHRLQSTQNKHSGPVRRPVFWFADNPPQAPASESTQEGGAE